MAITELDGVPYKCDRCGQTLGWSIGAALILGLASVRRRVELYCRKCGHRQTWHPSDAPAAKPAQHGQK